MTSYSQLLHRVRGLVLPVLVVTFTALALAACGGDDGDSGSSSSGGSSGGGKGKELFSQKCGGCHTLSDAGTSGQSGPNLDDAKPDAERVKGQIASGGGGMPAGLAEGEDADAIAEYVAGAAGK